MNGNSVSLWQTTFFYSGMAPVVQRKVISSGRARKEKLLTMSPWPLSLSSSLCPSVSPSPFFSFSHPRTGTQIYDVKLFPEDPVELIVGEALTLNCTAMVEFDTGVNIEWSYPGKQVRSSNGSLPEVNENLHFRVCFFSPEKQLGGPEALSWSSVSGHRGCQHPDHPQRECHRHRPVHLQRHQHGRIRTPTNSGHSSR